MPPEAVFFAGVITVAAATWLLTPIVRGLGERLRGGAPGAAELQKLRDDIQGLRDDLLAEQQQQRHELTDVVERLDFAERLLAKQRDAARIPPGRLGGE